MTSRVVPDGLVTARDQVLDELRRADTKATTLLSLVGAALAGVIALTGRSLPAPAVAGLWAAGAPLLAAVVLLLLVIRPRLHARNPIPGSWVHAARTDPTAMLSYYRTANPATRLATEVHGLARITRRKYKLIAAAVTLLVIGLALLAAALLLAIVAR